MYIFHFAREQHENAMRRSGGVDQRQSKKMRAKTDFIPSKKKKTTGKSCKMSRYCQQPSSAIICIHLVAS